jgi:hypothetical protein
VVYLKALLIAIAVVATSVEAGIAQTYYFGESLHEVSVSKSQEQRLEEIESRRNNEIERLQETLRTSRQQLRQQLFELDTELEQVLTAEQLRTLNAKRLEQTRDKANKNAQFMGQFAEFLKSVSEAESMIIYEGLPRASDDELANIKQKHETVDIDGWSFYSAPLAASPSIIEKLRSTLVDYRAFEPYTGVKFCGGFHPDFCVQWKVGEQTHNALVCLRCFELAYVEPSGKRTFDFNDAAWKSFAQIAIAIFQHHGDVIQKIDEAIGQ